MYQMYINIYIAIDVGVNKQFFVFFIPREVKKNIPLVWVILVALTFAAKEVFHCQVLQLWLTTHVKSNHIEVIPDVTEDNLEPAVDQCTATEQSREKSSEMPTLTTENAK